jgi:hypothetical protein
MYHVWLQSVNPLGALGTSLKNYQKVAKACLHVIYTFDFFVNFYFFFASTGRTTKSIIVFDSSNDSVWPKEVLFGGLIDKKIFRRPSLTHNFYWRFYMDVMKCNVNNNKN